MRSLGILVSVIAILGTSLTVAALETSTRRDVPSHPLPQALAVFSTPASSPPPPKTHATSEAPGLLQWKKTRINLNYELHF